MCPRLGSSSGEDPEEALAEGAPRRLPCLLRPARKRKERRMIAPTPVANDLVRIVYGAQLPGLPQSAVRLLELSRDRENGPEQFARAIEGDPGLASQVLRFVNSSYFGFSRKIASVKMAITLVGVRTIQNFALWSAIFNLVPNPRHGAFDLHSLWLDSLRRGLFAREVAKALGQGDPELCFAGGLLQDMALPILVKELEEEYGPLIDRRRQDSLRLSDLEFDQFGWTHAVAGGIIAEKWNLPENLTRIIEQHTELEQLWKQSPEPDEAKLVALSSMLPAAFDATWQELPSFLSAYAKMVPGNHPLGEILGRVDAQCARFAPVLEISSPGKSLLDYYRESLPPAL